MDPQSVFITRYVASHAASLDWYERLLGRPADDRPVPSCREWRLGGGVLFQVIELPERQGETSVAFRVADVEAQATRLRDAGVELDDPAPVEGFATLRYVETRDPEGVPLGLLDGE